LWSVGANLLQADATNVDELIVAAIREVSNCIGATTGGLWEFDRAEEEIRASHQWGEADAAPIGIDLSPSFVRDALAAGDGHAVVSLVDLFGEQECRARGWSDGRVVVSVVDRQPALVKSLVLVSEPPSWGSQELELVQGFSTLLRQLFGRRRAQEDLQERLMLDGLRSRIANLCHGATPDTLDQTLGSVLEEMQSGLNVDSASLICVDTAGTLKFELVAAKGSMPSATSREIPVEELGPEVGDFLASRRGTAQVDFLPMIEAMFGPSVAARFEARDTQRLATLCPVDESAARQWSLTTSRERGRPWGDHFDEWLDGIAALIAQARRRCRLEAVSRARLEAQRVIAGAGQAFLRVDAADAKAEVSHALNRLGQELGAEFATICFLEDNDDMVRIEQLWAIAEGRTFDLPVRVPLNLIEFAEDTFSELATVQTFEVSEALSVLFGGRRASLWTSITAPIAGGQEMGAVAFGFGTSELDDDSMLVETVATMADLIGQLTVRLTAQAALDRRHASDQVLAEIASDLLLSEGADEAGVVAQNVERFADRLGFESVVLVEGTTAQLSPSDNPRTVLACPVVAGGDTVGDLRVERVSGLFDDDAVAVRSLAVLLGQWHTSAESNRRDSFRLRSDRVLGRVAGQLAEAGGENLRAIVDSVLSEICGDTNNAAITIWRVDYELECYRVAYRGLAPDARPGEVSELAWGEDEWLDDVRLTGQPVQFEAPQPSQSTPSRLIFSRSEDPKVEGIVCVQSHTSGSWQPETVEMFVSFSRLLRDVEVRVSAERYADAAFSRAPVGIVLRDRFLNLITCNQSFLDFVGAETVDELVGTGPSELYADRFEDVAWLDNDGSLSGEAAFRRRDGGQVWGQMRGSVVGGDGGEEFWLVHIEDITRRRRNEQLLRFQATHDELTGLPNRRRLLDQVRSITATGTEVAVLLLDLDRFKNINDSLGHDRGDQLLVTIADRIRLAIRPGDTVARLGGDEFSVLLPGPVTVADAEFVAGRMLRIIGEPVFLGGQTVFPAASIGIALVGPDEDVTDLLRRADTAMYRAKAQGRAQHAVFDEQLQMAVTTRMATEAGLRGALRNDDFLVYYQPEVSIEDGRMLGAEALVRWNHPQRGVLAAAEFIDVAEETGLVVEMGELVLAQAVLEAASWPGGDDGPTVRVNLAAAQLQRDDTVALVRFALHDSGLPAHRLCLEITESAVMSDIERSEAILYRLKELGVQLAVDDFGTGFSSLAYLKRFPVDALKIDRAFVTGLADDPEDRAFVRSIISLAEALDLDVVAEGVETLEQAQVLTQLGCHRAQGYLYARPAPAVELASFLGT